MANSVSAIRTNENIVYPDIETPIETLTKLQEISDVAKEVLIEAKEKSFEEQELETNLIKFKLKGVLQFDKFCERLEAGGLQLTSDRRFVVDQLGKKILFSDLEASFNVLKETILLYIESRGYRYNPESELLTDGTTETAEQTQAVMKGFFTNQELISDLTEKLKLYQTVIDDVEVCDVIDFEEVKSTVKLFMGLDEFITLLKERGWSIQEMADTSQVVSPEGKIYFFKDVCARWKYQKNEVVQSLKCLGFCYNPKSTLFKYHQDLMTFDRVYDLIKKQVLDDLICGAQSIGFTFDTTKKLFIKGDFEESVREVVIQVNLSHIGL